MLPRIYFHADITIVKMSGYGIEYSLVTYVYRFTPKLLIFCIVSIVNLPSIPGAPPPCQTTI